MPRTKTTSNFYTTMVQFIKQNKLLHPNTKILLAVSGGIDSTVMLDAFFQLKNEWNLKLGIVHINHRLRGAEANEDEKFVRSLAEKYECPVFISRVSTKQRAKEKRISIQESARELRYAFFQKQRKAFGADAVATAHNADDNAETVLFNLCRGTGIAGLAGIPVRQHEGNIIRPLLFAERKEIEAYARSRHISFREDSSNLTEKYSRNFLRHTIFPALKRRINPAVVQTLLRTSEIMKLYSEFVSGEVEISLRSLLHERKNEVFLNVEQLRQKHQLLQLEILRVLLERKGIEPSFERINAVRSLSDAQKGSIAECGNGWVAERSADEIVFYKRNNRAAFDKTLAMPGTITVNGCSLTVKESIPPLHFKHDPARVYVDAKAVKFPLRVRTWKNGDRFIPLGMSKEKKVSDFFVDQKIPLFRKRMIPIVTSGNTIVWIAGLRLDDRFKITPQTKNAFLFTLHNNTTQ